MQGTSALGDMQVLLQQIQSKCEILQEQEKLSKSTQELYEQEKWKNNVMLQQLAELQANFDAVTKNNTELSNRVQEMTNKLEVSESRLSEMQISCEAKSNELEQLIAERTASEANAEKTLNDDILLIQNLNQEISSLHRKLADQQETIAVLQTADNPEMIKLAEKVESQNELLQQKEAELQQVTSEKFNRLQELANQHKNYAIESQADRKILIDFAEQLKTASNWKQNDAVPLIRQLDNLCSFVKVKLVRRRTHNLNLRSLRMRKFVQPNAEPEKLWSCRVCKKIFASSNTENMHVVYHGHKRNCKGREQNSANATRIQNDQYEGDDSDAETEILSMQEEEEYAENNSDVANNNDLDGLRETEDSDISIVWPPV